MIRPVAGLVAVALLCATARADTVYELPRTRARLELPDSWHRVEAAGLVASYKHAAGGVLAVSRADVPNPDAWKQDDAKTRAAYADTVERGIRSRIPGYKRVRKKLVETNGVPALDVEATRDGGATVVVRVLMFRTYALSLAIEIPKQGDIAIARVIAAKFTPPKE